jgi:hypothetical protein
VAGQEERLGREVVLDVPHAERAPGDVEAVAEAGGRGLGEVGAAGEARRVAQSGEDPGEHADLGLAVSRDGLAGGHGDTVGVEVGTVGEARAAVGLEQPESDGEKLHHLAGVVFVREAVERGVGLPVAQRAEVEAHPRVAGHGLEQLAVGAKRVFEQEVLITRHRALVVVERAHAVGEDKDLAEREGDALAQRIGGVVVAQRLAPPGLEALAAADGGGRGAVAEFGLPGQDQREVELRGAGELRVEPAGEAQRAHPRQLGRRGAEGRLGEETRGGFFRRPTVGRVGEHERGDGGGTERVARAGQQREGDGLVALGERVGERRQRDVGLVGAEGQRNRARAGVAVVETGQGGAAERERDGERIEPPGAAHHDHAGVGPVLRQRGVERGDRDRRGGGVDLGAQPLEVGDARIVGGGRGRVAAEALAENAPRIEARAALLPVTQAVAVAVDLLGAHAHEKPRAGGGHAIAARGAVADDRCERGPVDQVRAAFEVVSFVGQRGPVEPHAGAVLQGREGRGQARGGVARIGAEQALLQVGEAVAVGVGEEWKRGRGETRLPDVARLVGVVVEHGADVDRGEEAGGRRQAEGKGAHGGVG